jgi:hypothetical protein
MEKDESVEDMSKRLQKLTKELKNSKKEYSIKGVACKMLRSLP